MSYKSSVFLCLLASSIFTACAHEAAPVPPAPVPEVAQASSPDDDIIENLRLGNKRFTSHQRLHPRQDKARIAELTSGQAPGTIVVSCSDSRVPPEMVFDKGLGDIFSVRTAGHAIGPNVLASVEYAIENLGSKVILVLGHTSCGAVKATATAPAGKSTGSKNIDQLLNNIRPGLKHVDLKDKELKQAAIDNVEAAIVNMKKGSAIIRKAVEQQKVMIVPALYYLDSGEVEVW